MRRAQLRARRAPAAVVLPVGSRRPARARIIDEMRVGVLDVGSNTARLLVADVGHDGNIVPPWRRRASISVSAPRSPSSGTLRAKTIATTAAVCRRYAKRARGLGSHPGRDHRHRPRPAGGCRASFVARLSDETRLPVRILSADEEGELAYRGRGLTFSIARRGASSAWSTSAADRPSSSSVARPPARRGSGRSTWACSG